MKRQIELAKPKIGFREILKVIRVLISGKLAQGVNVLAFESEFSKFVNGRECVAVNSGTSGLHAALLALGIGAGDEVIVPSFTFAATANSVALTGATPIFVDIDIETFCISPKAIESSITKNTRAIQIVHLYGLPANMNEIAKIAKKYNLLVVEDAAQAHLASIGSQPVGTFGDAAVFSFYPTKNMTSGEGGMVVLRESEIARKVRLLRNQGMEKKYENEIVGMNLRLSEIHAAIGRVQLQKLPKWTKKRQSNAQFLTENLQSVVCPFVPKNYSHVYHQYTIKVKSNREKIISALEEEKISCGIYYPTPVHRLPAFSQSANLINTQIACDQVLSLPVHPSLTRKELKRIIKVINRVTKE